MDDATRVLHAGLPVPAQGAPFLPPPTFAAPFHLSGDPGDSPYVYGRYGNPTWTAFEEALSELEGGPAVVFPSGMAAITALLSVALHPGDTLVMPDDGYYTARSLARTHFRDAGIDIRTTPIRSAPDPAVTSGAALIWLETPSNPGLDVCDIAAWCDLAHARGALVAVDNTTATVLGQRPLALGADFSVSSDTKGLTGHGDIVLGHVACRDREQAERLRGWRLQSGSIPGPMEVWLAHRSLFTLDVRLERQCANALTLARMLSSHPSVCSVRYPGLSGDPSHAIASRQMSRYGSVIGFTLRDAEAAERFLSASRLVFSSTSFGGVHTTAERRARWGGDQVPDGFIRLSVGCEHGQDLQDDVAQALDAAGAP